MFAEILLIENLSLCHNEHLGEYIMKLRHTHKLLLALLVSASVLSDAQAITIDPFFDPDYNFTDLGSVPGLPPLYGGLTFKNGDANTVIIGGNANTASGLFYEVGVTRGAGNHITGFTGSATAIGLLGEYNDGGIAYGPGGVLFTSRWPVNEFGQTKPGSTDEDKIVDLAALGVAGSHAALNFVPAGFGGAGDLKLVSWSGGEWYTTVLTPDGSGTFDIAVTPVDLDITTMFFDNLPGGPEGFVYVDAVNPGFGVDSLLVSDFSAGSVSIYDLDGLGNPLVTTRRNFISDLTGVEGAAIDPLTGDFLFTTFGGGDRVVVVSGFIAPNPPPNGVPEPAMLTLMGFGLAGIGLMRRQKKNV